MSRRAALVTQAEIAALTMMREVEQERASEAEKREAKLRAELATARNALEKIAAINVPFPETNMEGYASMAVVTAREALAHIDAKLAKGGGG